MPSSIDEESPSLPCVTQQSGDSLKLRISFPTIKDSSKSMDLKSPNLHLVLSNVHDQLVRRDSRGIFAHPVTDAIAAGYSDLIKHPIDLSTIADRLHGRSYYHTASDYLTDITRMCDNAMVYNGPNTVYHQKAMKLLTYCRRIMMGAALRKLSIQLGLPDGLTDVELGDACLFGELPIPIDPWMSVYCRRLSDSSKLRSSCSRSTPPWTKSPLLAQPYTVGTYRQMTTISSPMPRPIVELERVNIPSDLEPSTSVEHQHLSSELHDKINKLWPFIIGSAISDISSPFTPRRGRGRPRKYPKIAPTTTESASPDNVKTCQSPITTTQFPSSMSATPRKVESPPKLKDSSSSNLITSSPNVDSAFVKSSPSSIRFRMAKRLSTDSLSPSTTDTSQCTSPPRVSSVGRKKNKKKEEESITPLVEPRSWRKRTRDVHNNSRLSSDHLPAKSARHRHRPYVHSDRDASDKDEDKIPAPSKSSSPVEVKLEEPENEVLIEARKMAAKAASRLRSRYDCTTLHGESEKVGFGPKICFLNCDAPGKITATLCPKAVSKEIEAHMKAELTVNPPPLPVKYPNIFVHCLTGMKPNNESKPDRDRKIESAPLLDPPTADQLEILSQLDKLKYNPDEPLSAGIHGPLAIFSSSDLARLSDVYGSDLSVIEYAYSLLRFVEPMGRWARRWAAKRLDAATDGMHSQLANFSQLTVPHLEKEGEVLAADPDQPSCPPQKSWMESVHLTVDSPTPPSSPESSAFPSFDIDQLNSNSPLLKHLLPAPDEQTNIPPITNYVEQSQTSSVDQQQLLSAPVLTDSSEPSTTVTEVSNAVVDKNNISKQYESSCYPRPIENIPESEIHKSSPPISIDSTISTFPESSCSIGSPSILKSVLNTPILPAVYSKEVDSSLPVNPTECQTEDSSSLCVAREFDGESRSTTSTVGNELDLPSTNSPSLLKAVLTTAVLPAIGEKEFVRTESSSIVHNSPQLVNALLLPSINSDQPISTVPELSLNRFSLDDQSNPIMSSCPVQSADTLSNLYASVTNFDAEQQPMDTSGDSITTLTLPEDEDNNENVLDELVGTNSFMEIDPPISLTVTNTANSPSVSGLSSDKTLDSVIESFLPQDLQLITSSTDCNRFLNTTTAAMDNAEPIVSSEEFTIVHSTESNLETRNPPVVSTVSIDSSTADFDISDDVPKIADIPTLTQQQTVTDSRISLTEFGSVDPQSAVSSIELDKNPMFSSVSSPKIDKCSPQLTTVELLNLSDASSTSPLRPSNLQLEDEGQPTSESIESLTLSGSLAADASHLSTNTIDLLACTNMAINSDSLPLSGSPQNCILQNEAKTDTSV